jgi:hypothetical protein
MREFPPSVSETGSGFIAGAAAVQLRPTQVTGQIAQNASGTLQALMNTTGRAILLKDGIVLSMDPNVGDFEKGDILIRGKKIVSVGRNLDVLNSAIVSIAPAIEMQMRHGMPPIRRHSDSARSRHSAELKCRRRVQHDC